VAAFLADIAPVAAHTPVGGDSYFRLPGMFLAVAVDTPAHRIVVMAGNRAAVVAVMTDNRIAVVVDLLLRPALCPSS